MGGVIGTLICFYCQSGCQASVVASYLAFHPPEPSYKIDEKNEDEKSIYSITLDQPLPKASKKYVPTVHVITTSTKSKIPILFFKADDAKYTIIYSHGNATDLGGMYPILLGLCIHLKVNIVGYDYTGYGPCNSSTIRTTEKQTYKDITAVYQWLIDNKHVIDSSKEVILYGQSVGSGPSCYLASKKPIAGLILHSGILSGIRVLTSSRLLYCFDIFPNINRIQHVHCPVFILHGQDDVEVGFHHGTGLHAAVPLQYQTEPWWVPKRGHNDVLSNNENEFIRRMQQFLLRVDAHNDKKEHQNNSYNSSNNKPNGIRTAGTMNQKTIVVAAVHTTESHQRESASDTFTSLNKVNSNASDITTTTTTAVECNVETSTAVTATNNSKYTSD